MPTETEELVCPQTLIEIMRTNQEGYVLRFGYRLELRHGGMGGACAIANINNAKEPVYTDDLSVLEDVWNLLPKNQSAVSATLYYGKPELNEWYIVSDGLLASEDYKTAKPFTFVTREQFEALRNSETTKFRWSAVVSDYGPSDWPSYIAKAIAEVKNQYT